MKLKTFLFLLAGCICILLGLIFKSDLYEKAGQQKPNILLISLDACRADHLSCYGYSRETSPFIDEIASGGTRFDNAFVNTLATPSSHTTIFTSLYQETHEVELIEQFGFTVPKNIVMLQELLQKEGYITIAVTDTEIFEKIGFNRGFLEFDYTEKMSHIKSGANKLIHLLKKHINDRRPVFAFFHTYEIHLPYSPPLKYRNIFGQYDSAIKPNAINVGLFANSANKLDESDIEFLKARYDGEIRYTDDMLEKIFSELRKINFFDNYLVVITSDHGEEFGEHGGLSHRGSLLYDELLHVPLIMSGNAIPKGKVVDRMVNSVDIMPTILGLANIEIKIPVEGRNLFSSHRESDGPERQEGMVFAQYRRSSYAVRTQEWKYIQNHKQNTFELFHLFTDPYEKKDVSDAYPNIRNKFANILSEWKRSRIKMDKLETEKINYSEETLEKLRSLGYLQ